MFNFLHTFNPQPILISFGPINVYWYGIFIVAGILAALLVALKIAELYKIDKNLIIDSSFILIIGGIIGARLYHVILELPFYLNDPIAIFKVWQGGLAIHGAIFAGIFLVWYLARKNKINFWLFASLFLPGLALAQAIGRWGNYFNQELFGRPTNLPWGVPIEPANRIIEYYNSQYFHPVFLYESLGNFLIFLILFASHYYFYKKNNSDSSAKKKNSIYIFIVSAYLMMYSVLRFSLEFIRVDTTLTWLGLRLPQVISLLLIAIAAVIFYYSKRPEANIEKK